MDNHSELTVSLDESWRSRRSLLQNIFLAVASGVLLGVAYPPFHLGLLASVGFVPFFALLTRLKNYGSVFRYSYLMSLVLNLVTLYWIGGFTHGNDRYLMMAGAALLIGHPFFFCVPIVIYFFFKKHLGENLSLFALPFLWVAFEWVHSLGEIGFPWLTLGNTHTYDIARIQFIEYTGVYGISFFLMAINSIVCFLYHKLLRGDWLPFSRKSLGFLFGIGVLYSIPTIHGTVVLSKANEHKRDNILSVGIMQPNEDPWKKWRKEEQEQLQRYLQLTENIVKQNVDVLIWPETAISYRILSPQFTKLYEALKNRIDSLDVALVTGFPDIQFYPEGKAPYGSKIIPKINLHYNDFNAIMFLQPYSSEVQKYGKMRLVPFAERTPYWETFTFLGDLLHWNVGISGWGIGKDTTVFVMESRAEEKGRNKEVRFSGMVCYESIYPELVSQFVKRGAQFLVIVTNDSWWGNTSGAYQHAQYAVLRAIENRRAIARCANGGISCFIDPYGRMTQATQLYTEANLVDSIEFRDDLTFYSRHGDVFARLCFGGSIVFVLVGILKSLTPLRKG